MLKVLYRKKLKRQEKRLYQILIEEYIKTVIRLHYFVRKHQNNMLKDLIALIVFIQIVYCQDVSGKMKN